MGSGTMTELTEEVRECAHKYYRRGLQTADRLSAAVEDGTASAQDKLSYEKAIAGINKVWEQCGGARATVEGEAPSQKEQIDAFKSFKRTGAVKRIMSKKLGKMIILCPTSADRDDIERLDTVEEAVYTCDEIIVLIKAGLGVEALLQVNNVMEGFDGEIAMEFD